MAKKDPIRFVAESTLGKLAKWLRLLGFDTAYEREAPGGSNRQPGRIRLTRTRRMLKSDAHGRLIFIASDGYIEQVRQVIQELGLTSADIAPFTRCIRCNEPIQPIEKPSVFGQVPDYIWETQDTFCRCPQCHRVYWPGSHTQQSLARIRKLFEE